MSGKWPSKSPAEVLDYSFDWSRLLGSADIAMSTWYIQTDSQPKVEFPLGFTIAGLTNGGKVNTAKVSSIVLADGDLNIQYKLYCSITDTLGRVSERNAVLVVRER